MSPSWNEFAAILRGSPALERLVRRPSLQGHSWGLTREERGRFSHQVVGC